MTKKRTPGKTENPPRLPGDLTPAEVKERAIRVDHAGEYGAVRIYKGQMAVLGGTASADVIRHMAEQEDRHLAAFDRLVAENQVRPTALLPLWHVAGYVLGAGTALLGERAAMACTVAVEDVIVDHYGRQLETLDESEVELRTTVREFQAEEAEHKEMGLSHGAEQAPGYEVLSGVVKAGSRLAIWLSERI